MSDCKEQKNCWHDPACKPFKTGDKDGNPVLSNGMKVLSEAACARMIIDIEKQLEQSNDKGEK